MTSKQHKYSQFDPASVFRKKKQHWNQCPCCASTHASNLFCVPCRWSQVIYDFVLQKLGLAITTAICALLGIFIGLIIRASNPDSANISQSGLRLIGIPGVLWLNAIKCAVLPLIACAMIQAVISLRQSSAAPRLGAYTVTYYLTAIAFAGMEALLWAEIVLIPNTYDLDLAELNDDTTAPEYVHQRLEDEVLLLATAFVPDNLMDAVVRNNLMGVILISLIIGKYLQTTDENHSTILRLVKEGHLVISKILDGLIYFTPIGTFFIILPQAIALDFRRAIAYLSVYLGTAALAFAFHMLVTYPLFYFFVTRGNPYKYMRGMISAMSTAFGTASSAATLPVTIRCATERNGVDGEIANFVLPFGSTCAMDGTAINTILGVAFLAYAQGIKLNFLEMLAVVVMSSISSLGSAPIPNASIVVIVMIMDSVQVPLTGLFGLYIAMDWLGERVRSVVNVTGDLYAAGIVHFLSLHDDDIQRGKHMAEMEGGLGLGIHTSDAPINYDSFNGNGPDMSGLFALRDSGAAEYPKDLYSDLEMENVTAQSAAEIERDAQKRKDDDERLFIQ